MTSTMKQAEGPSVHRKLANPLVRMILASRLHRILDNSILVLHMTGRKTGRHYDIPVAYVDMDMTGELAIVTAARWRVNLRGKTEVDVTLRGAVHRMHVLLDEDPAAVAVRCQEIIDRIGWKRARRRLGVSLPGGGVPTAVELKDAAISYGWSVITLTPQ